MVLFWPWQNESFFGPSSGISYPVPWTPRDVSAGLIVAVMWVIILAVLGGIAQRAGLPIDPSLIVLFGTTLLLIPVWYFTVFKYKVSWSDLGLRRFQLRAVGLGLGLMLISLLFNLGYAAVLSLFDLQIQPDIGPMFDDTSFPLFLLLGGAVVAPFVEEVFLEDLYLQGSAAGGTGKMRL